MTLFDLQPNGPEKRVKKTVHRSPNTRNAANRLSRSPVALCTHSWTVTVADEGRKTGRQLGCSNCGATWNQCAQCQRNRPPAHGAGGLSGLPAQASQAWVSDHECGAGSGRVHIPAVLEASGVPTDRFALYQWHEAAGAYQRGKIVAGT